MPQPGIHKTADANGSGTTAALNCAVQIFCVIDSQAVKGMNSIRTARAAEIVDDAFRNFAMALGVSLKTNPSKVGPPLTASHTSSFLVDDQIGGRIEAGGVVREVEQRALFPSSSRFRSELEHVAAATHTTIRVATGQ